MSQAAAIATLVTRVTETNRPQAWTQGAEHHDHDSRLTRSITIQADSEYHDPGDPGLGSGDTQAQERGPNREKCNGDDICYRATRAWQL